MNRQWTAVVVLMALFAAGTPARAWNHSGHLTVALLAYRRLPEAQRVEIARLLKAHPHYTRYLVKDRPPEVREDEWAFLMAATWPDYVRGNRGHADPELEQYHHAPWHYINLPYYWPGEPAPPLERQPRPEVPNVISALEENARILGDSAARNDARAIALCWVLHLAGDLHQPLHCTSLVSRRFPPPGGDQGGNRVAVRSQKHPEPLHAYWDRLLGTNKHYRAIDLAATKIARDAEADGELQSQLHAHTTIESWAEEGRQAAATFAYLEGRLPLVEWRAIEEKTIPASEAPILPSGYAADARDIARRRAAMAGYRLAAMLEVTLPRAQ